MGCNRAGLGQVGTPTVNITEYAVSRFWNSVRSGMFGRLRRTGNIGCNCVRRSLTGSRGENLRVVGIHSDG